MRTVHRFVVLTATCVITHLICGVACLCSKGSKLSCDAQKARHFAKSLTAWLTRPSVMWPPWICQPSNNWLSSHVIKTPQGVLVWSEWRLPKGDTAYFNTWRWILCSCLPEIKEPVQARRDRWHEMTLNPLTLGCSVMCKHDYLMWHTEFKWTSTYCTLGLLRLTLPHCWRTEKKLDGSMYLDTHYHI